MRLSAIPDLLPEIVMPLENQGIKTESDLLSLTGVDIMRKLPYGQSTLSQINLHQTVVAGASSALGLSARYLLHSTPVNSPTKKVKLCAAESLKPVLHTLTPYTGRVIEVSGHTGSRKTEFILNVVMANLSSDANMSVYWVDTVGGLLADQALDIASRLLEEDVQGCLERIRWSLISEVEQVYDLFEEVSASAKVDGDNSAGIGYLVIDTITSLLGPILTTSSSQGHVLMTEVMRHLRAIAKAHSITVLVINDPTSKSLLNDPRQLPKLPALGPTFTFLTDATIWITMDLRQQPLHDPSLLLDDCTPYRIEVLKANFMGSKAFGTFVLKSGLYLVL